jgi:predicted transcriptional regulator
VDSSNRPRKSFIPDGISNDGAVDQDADHVANGTPARRTAKIATVSHTLDATIADRLRHFAFRQRISESAVIEFALRELFEGAEDAALGTRLRDAGAALRRKT